MMQYSRQSTPGAALFRGARCLISLLPLFIEQAPLSLISNGREKGGLDVRGVAITFCSRERLN
jgi:hypothetical protein